MPAQGNKRKGKGKDEDLGSRGSFHSRKESPKGKQPKISKKESSSSKVLKEDGGVVRKASPGTGSRKDDPVQTITLNTTTTHSPTNPQMLPLYVGGGESLLAEEAIHVDREAIQRVPDGDAAQEENHLSRPFQRQQGKQFFDALLCLLGTQCDMFTHCVID
jgi:hypothetical protein